MGGAKRPQPKRLPTKLRQIREALGYTQEEMVKYLGLKGKVPRSYLSRFENGAREPPLEVLLKYSELARVWMNALVNRRYKNRSYAVEENVVEKGRESA